ncbi:hypothetical protein M1466_01410 [Candidatus Dependentiae bacterium]|nr:hypothetical protein [Candidatus Dependentiae bacterium]
MRIIVVMVAVLFCMPIRGKCPDIGDVWPINNGPLSLLITESVLSAKLPMRGDLVLYQRNNGDLIVVGIKEIIFDKSLDCWVATVVTKTWHAAGFRFVPMPFIRLNQLFVLPLPCRYRWQQLSRDGLVAQVDSYQHEIPTITVVS